MTAKSLLVMTVAGLVAIATLPAISAQIMVPELSPIEDKPPGIGFRLHEMTLRVFMDSMSKFLPHYLYYDVDFNSTVEEYDFALLFGFLRYKMLMKNIDYKPPQLDFMNTTIIFDNEFNKQHIKVNFPAIKSWKVESDVSINCMLFPEDTRMMFDMEDIIFKFNTELKVTPEGWINPNIWAIDLNWGHSQFYHENAFAALIFDQTIHYLMVIVQNALYFMGEIILNGMLEPPLTQGLNYYQLPFGLKGPFNGQDTYDHFSIDLRHHPKFHPAVNKGYLDLFLIGETSYKDLNCEGAIYDDHMHFKNMPDRSQLVVGESTLSCFVNKVAASDIGKIQLDTERFNQLFGVEGYYFNTSSIAPHVQLFEEKLGKDKPLVVDLTFNHFHIELGQYDVDIAAQFEMCFSMKTDMLGA